MTSDIHDFHRLVILTQATPRRHGRVLLSLEKQRYTAPGRASAMTIVSTDTSTPI